MKTKTTKKIGLLLLAVYLIVIGLAGLFSFNFGALSFIVPALALAAGILVLLDR